MISTEFGVDYSFSGSVFLASFTKDIKYTNTYTTAYTANTTITNTTTNTDNLLVTGPPCNGNPCSPAYAGPASFNIYQDNIWGTYVFIP